MKLYNTMSRSKEEFEPQIPGRVSAYACGPTVYNLMHIGNARQICVFDVLRRYLKFSGYDVTYAQNFTDIDDKIIAKAAEEGCSYQDISEKYIGEYFTDAHGLNVMDADIHPKATECMDSIISMVSGLIDSGNAYAAENGDVYFSTASFPGYGKLSRQPLDDLRAGARIAPGDEKREPVDFAVWKAAKEGEPYWDSPWGKGRPGWHIECSAMVNKYFGSTIDIHGGGQDLIFPHHENEIAQSESFTGESLADYWVHNGHVNVDNKKMSKSLGNFFTVREVAEKYGFEPIRYLMISSHYRSPMNYSTESLEQSSASLERLYNCKENLEFIIANGNENPDSENEQKTYESLLKHKAAFSTAMEDDLNTADALASIFDLAREINTNLPVSSNVSKPFAEKVLGLFMQLCSVLGLLYAEKKNDIDAEIESLIQKRQEARKNKDWAAADSIRDELAKRNIVLEDTPSGIKWKVIDKAD